MKLKMTICVVILLLISSLCTYAQEGLPCSDTDNDGSCPLDTWVIVLVVVVSIFGAFRLYRLKKNAPQIIR